MIRKRVCGKDGTKTEICYTEVIILIITRKVYGKSGLILEYLYLQLYGLMENKCNLVIIYIYVVSLQSKIVK